MTLRRFPFRPLEAAPPDLTANQFEAALQRVLAQKRETGVVRFTPGCDGRNIVTAYQGPCHDAASPINGGQSGVAIDLGNGARVVVAADLGRGYSASSGYPGAGSAGAFPPPQSLAAADLGLDPIDDTATVAHPFSDWGVSPSAAGDPPSGDWSSGDFAGDLARARIYGHTGASRRMAVCFGDAAKPKFWNDITSGSGSTVTSGPAGSPATGLWHVIPWNDERCFLFTQGFYNSDVPRWYRHRDRSGTTETLELDGWGAAIDDWETGLWIMATASACNRDFSLLGMIAHALAEGGVPEGRQAIVISSGQYLPGPTGSSGSEVNVPGIRYLGSTIKAMVDHKVLCFDHEGTVYVGARWYQTALPDHAIIKKVLPPYTPEAAASQISYGGGESWGQNWDDFPTPLVGSRDGRYMASTRRAGDASCVDLWALPVNFPPPLKSLQGVDAAAGAQIRGIGTMAFGPDGTLFAVVGSAGVPSYLLVWTKGDNEWGDDPEVITLTYDAGANGWLSVSADGQTVVVSGYTAGAMTKLQIVQAPFTNAGATVTIKSLSNPLTTFSFDQPSNYGAWSNGLRLRAQIRSVTESGSELHALCRLTWTASESAWAVEIRLPIPTGASLVSTSDGGEVDPADGALVWWIGTVGADDTGYVEATLRVR